MFVESLLDPLSFNIMKGGFFMVKIYLDPGHGGKDSGAIGHGLLEKDITLKLALKTRDYLQQYNHVDIKMSRTTDKTVSLNERTNAANEWKADYFVSIHINAGGGTGFESFIYNQLANSSETAKRRSILHGKIAQNNNMRDRGKKKANFHVLRETRMSAVLTENGFIDTASDVTQLKNAAWIDGVARAHAEGIAEIFQLKKGTSGTGAHNGFDMYKVKKGDKLSQIARQHNMSVDDLVHLNNLIREGQMLKVIPTSKIFEVGDRVIVKKSATHYATGEMIPSWVKERTFTISQKSSDRLLLKEIYSWVKLSDVM